MRCFLRSLRKSVRCIALVQKPFFLGETPTHLLNVGQKVRVGVEPHVTHAAQTVAEGIGMDERCVTSILLVVCSRRRRVDKERTVHVVQMASGHFHSQRFLMMMRHGVAEFRADSILVVAAVLVMMRRIVTVECPHHFEGIPPTNRR